MSKLAGNAFEYNYGDTVYRIHFKSEDTLHWHCVEGDEKGSEADETYHVHQLADNTFFISWIEADGTGVSQVLNLDEMSIHCFLKIDKDCIPLSGSVKKI